MDSEQTGFMIGHFVGLVFGPVLFAWITSLITRVLGKLAKQPHWHGWYAGLAIACLTVLGQMAIMNVIGVAGTLLGTLIVWNQAAQKSKGS